MKIDKNYKLDKAVSVKACRPAIENILVCRDGKQELAIATNGRIMAIVPVTIESETELGLISPKAMAYGRKVTKAKEHEITMIPHGNIAFLDGSALHRPTEQDCGNYPNWKVVSEPNKNAKIAFTVALDPRLLLALAEAIGCDGEAHKGVVLRFIDELSPIQVRTNNAESTAHGVLMPMRVTT